MSVDPAPVVTTAPVPAPGRGTAPMQAWQLPSAPARLVLAAPRGRLPEPDRVDFDAACPACGGQARWSEVRDDTRVRISVECACAEDASA